MRIAYLLAEDLTNHPGLKHKIETQIHYWQSRGHDVFRIHHFDGTVVRPDGTQQTRPNNYQSNSKASKWERLSRLSLQYAFVLEALNEIKPDITYSRYLFPAKNLVQIKEYAGQLILEINSDDRAEYLQKRWITGVFNALFRHQLLRTADGFVFVTNELANKSTFSAYTSKRHVIGNGVEVDVFQFSDKTDNSNPQLVFIGSPGQSWHGLDKIGTLAEGIPEFGFHIIGPDRAECVRLWKQIPDNVVFHGYLTNAEAQNIIKDIDVGISTLALHRNDMHEACPLKVRQYLAHGLPVIAASSDPDIEGQQDFYLRLPNDEQNVSECLDEIRTFVIRVTGDANIRCAARRYAAKYLSASKKEAERLAFFEKVLSS